MSPPPQNIFLTGDKYKYATDKSGKPNLLIDDFKKYIVPWEKAGGIAILHTSAEDTIRQLKEIQEESQG